MSSRVVGARLLYPLMAGLLVLGWSGVKYLKPRFNCAVARERKSLVGVPVTAVGTTGLGASVAPAAKRAERLSIGGESKGGAVGRASSDFTAVADDPNGSY